MEKLTCFWGIWWIEALAVESQVIRFRVHAVNWCGKVRQELIAVGSDYRLGHQAFERNIRSVGKRSQDKSPRESAATETVPGALGELWLNTV